MDKLMGPSRNMAKNERTGEEFKEENICKHYLVGFCPDGVLGKVVAKEMEFSTHPLRPIPCTRVHSLGMKQEFESHPKAEEFRKQYEDGLRRRIEEIISECDRREAIERKKCKPKESTVRLPDSLKMKIHDYEITHRKLLKEAAELGEKGDVKGAEAIMVEVEDTQHQMDSIHDTHTQYFPGEEACNICGVKYLLGTKGSGAEETRGLTGYTYWDDHVDSKLHQGYKDARDKLAKVRQAHQASRPADDRPGADDGADDRRGAEGQRGGGDRRGADDRRGRADSRGPSRRGSRGPAGNSRGAEGNGRRGNDDRRNSSDWAADQRGADRRGNARDTTRGDERRGADWRGADRGGADRGRSRSREPRFRDARHRDGRR